MGPAPIFLWSDTHWSGLGDTAFRLLDEVVVVVVVCYDECGIGITQNYRASLLIIVICRHTADHGFLQEERL